MELPPEVDALFRTQRGGLVALRQMVRLGHDRREVAAWAHQGLIERVLHGLYRRVGSPVPPTQSLHVPLRYLPLRAPAGHGAPLIAGGAALAVHGADGFALPWTDPLVLVDHRCRVRSGTHPFDVRRVDMASVERDHVGGVPVTTPWRAIGDAALDPDIADQRLRVAVDSLRNRRVLEIVHAVRCWQQLGHRGGRRMAAMADAGVFEQESDGERAAFATLFGHGAPLPDCQVVVLGQMRVDFVFLHAALVIEYLGRPHDGRADQDVTRIAALEGLGLRVLLASRSMMRDAPVHRARIESIRRDRLARVLAGSLPLPAIPPQPPRLTPLRTILPGQLHRVDRWAA